MRFVFFALGLVLLGVVRGVQDKSSRETEPVYYDLDHGSDNFVLESDILTTSTTARPRHHVHPLEMASDLNIPDLCNCFSKIEVSQDCIGRYPDNLRILWNGSIQNAYVTDDKSLVNSKSLPLIIISSGQQKNLVLQNETLVLLCELSIGSPLENLRFHHISRIHMSGQILQDRKTPMHLTFIKITTPITFPAGSLHLLPSAAASVVNADAAAKKLTTNDQQSNNSNKKSPCWVNSVSSCLLVSLGFKECTSVIFESNSVVVPELMLNAEHVDLLKLYPEAITLTSPRPILALRVFNSRMLTMQTNAIMYANIDVATEACGQIHPVVEFERIQQVSLTQNALKLLPCTNLTLRNIYLTHAGIAALTNLPKVMLNRVLITHVQGDANLMPGAICLLANSVKVAGSQLYTENLHEDGGDVIRLAGVKSVDVVEGSLVGVRTCQQQEAEVLGMQGCQICQDKKASNTTVTPTGSYVLKQKMQEHLEEPSEVAGENSINLLQNKMLLLYLVVAASILTMAIIAAFIIYALRKRKKRMSWKVPSLPWAKSQHNTRHPALAAKASYRASRDVSGTPPECYTIFDSIAAAKQVQLPPSSQNAKEKQPSEEKQDQQDSNYSEPVDTLATSRRHSHVYANPSNIKGGDGSIGRSSAFSDRRLSASAASVASSIEYLNTISSLSVQDRRKSSFGLLIDITSALGIESNYKQLTNK